MADHVFTGLIETVFPYSKDTQGRNIGTVEPCEIRDTDGPIDPWWHEATDEDRERWAAIVAARENPAGPHEHPGFGDVPMHGTEGTPDGTFSEIGGEAPGSEGAAGEPHDAEPDEPETGPGD